MVKRHLLALVGLLSLTFAGLIVQPAAAQGISQKVAVCNPLYTARCVQPDANGAVPVTGAGGVGTTVTTAVVRPTDTAPYGANDAWANSTSAPTTGGFTFTDACRTSGGTGAIISATVISSNDPATLLQGEIWVFDSAVTAINDNAAFALSDADAVKLIPGGVIPFTLASTTGGSGTNSFVSLPAQSIGFTCSGSANLRFLIKVKNAYTPASGETLTVRLAVVQFN